MLSVSIAPQQSAPVNILLHHCHKQQVFSWYLDLELYVYFCCTRPTLHMPIKIATMYV